MSLISEWHIGATGMAAIWQIEEDEHFFNLNTGLKPEINNPKRRIEHLAGRFLLRHIRQDFPLQKIVKDIHNKPFLTDYSLFFSVSHSWPYVAAVVDSVHQAGIDIQTYHPRILNIQNKYLSATERRLFENDPQLLTMAWCAKESVYKWYGKRGIDFIKHMPITDFQAAPDKYNLTVDFQCTPQPTAVHTENIITEHYACSYIINSK
jgi:4'-phosphopantetheinyl transferase